MASWRISACTGITRRLPSLPLPLQVPHRSGHGARPHPRHDGNAVCHSSSMWSEGVRSLALPRHKVGEVEDICIGHRLEHFGHRGVVSGAYVRLVFAHRLDEKILALTGDAGDVIAARKIRVVADVAAVLARESPATLNARSFSRISHRQRWRQFCDCVGKGAQIVVTKALR